MASLVGGNLLSSGAQIAGSPDVSQVAAAAAPQLPDLLALYTRIYILQRQVEAIQPLSTPKYSKLNSALATLLAAAKTFKPLFEAVLLQNGLNAGTIHLGDGLLACNVSPEDMIDLSEVNKLLEIQQGVTFIANKAISFPAELQSLGASLQDRNVVQLNNALHGALQASRLFFQQNPELVPSKASQANLSRCLDSLNKLNATINALINGNISKELSVSDLEALESSVEVLKENLNESLAGYRRFTMGKEYIFRQFEKEARIVESSCEPHKEAFDRLMTQTKEAIYKNFKAIDDVLLFIDIKKIKKTSTDLLKKLQPFSAQIQATVNSNFSLQELRKAIEDTQRDLKEFKALENAFLEQQASLSPRIEKNLSKIFVRLSWASFLRDLEAINDTVRDLQASVQCLESYCEASDTIPESHTVLLQSNAEWKRHFDAFQDSFAKALLGSIDAKERMKRLKDFDQKLRDSYLTPTLAELKAKLDGIMADLSVNADIHSMCETLVKRFESNFLTANHIPRRRALCDIFLDSVDHALWIVQWAEKMKDIEVFISYFERQLQLLDDVDFDPEGNPHGWDGSIEVLVLETKRKITSHTEALKSQKAAKDHIIGHCLSLYNSSDLKEHKKKLIDALQQLRELLASSVDQAVAEIASNKFFEQLTQALNSVDALATHLEQKSHLLEEFHKLVDTLISYARDLQKLRCARLLAEQPTKQKDKKKGNNGNYSKKMPHLGQQVQSDYEKLIAQLKTKQTHPDNFCDELFEQLQTIWTNSYHLREKMFLDAVSKAKPKREIPRLTLEEALDPLTSPFRLPKTRQLYLT